ncbi:Guanylate cyclase [Seminavis robusta]|uniref:Guanylate cyclase n=1 Tax=Seminavis robusta TaxID=568900 RepID=A0A9N8HD15_9STRA|nr:Guanylate cyclase [Seminavis robusta]|eukprot:Sro241_g096510.1 Guanylate cyclase (362) ;mRNA; f:84535-85781
MMANDTIFDDEDDYSVVSETMTDTEGAPSEERDEKKEVYKMSAKDTRHVRLWRFVATLALLVTALVVTLTTYRFLKAEETSNFEVAFERFSLKQWLPIFLTTGRMSGSRCLAFMLKENAMAQAKVEFLSWTPRVSAEQYDSYIEFVNANYKEIVDEGHMFYYGDLSRISTDPRFSRPPPFIAAVGPEGFGPDKPRDAYWPNQIYAPPDLSYALNTNIGSFRNVEPAVEALEHLQYETVFTGSSSSGSRASDGILGAEVHATYHSQFNGTTKTPHGYVLHPVHQDPLDQSSSIVGMISAGFAFDASLRNLIPDGVQGITCVVTSNMAANFSYVVDGQNAFFLGMEDHHESKYDEYAVQWIWL